MATRTTSRTIEFRNGFILRGISEMQPAGRYTVDTDEEPIDSLHGNAYRRVGTWIWLTSAKDGRGIVRMVSINPDELEAALILDARSAMVRA
jgi:hypothetical protein